MAQRKSECIIVRRNRGHACGAYIGWAQTRIESQYVSTEPDRGKSKIVYQVAVGFNELESSPKLKVMISLLPAEVIANDRDGNSTLLLTWT